jgi:hypothetical protein
VNYALNEVYTMRSVHFFIRSSVLVAVVASGCAFAAYLRFTRVKPIDLDNPPPWNRPIEPRQRTGPSPDEVIRRDLLRTGIPVEDQIEAQ